MSKFNIQRHDKKLKSLTKELGCRSKLHEKFLCPILFLNEKTELCKGHIVPRSAGGTNWVVQRKDVDNFFGSFAGADFAHGLKLRGLSSSNDMLDYVSKHKMARTDQLNSTRDGRVCWTSQRNASRPAIRRNGHAVQGRCCGRSFSFQPEHGISNDCHLFAQCSFGSVQTLWVQLRGAQDRTIDRVFGLEKPVSAV